MTTTKIFAREIRDAILCKCGGEDNCTVHCTVQVKMTEVKNPTKVFFISGSEDTKINLRMPLFRTAGFLCSCSKMTQPNGHAHVSEENGTKEEKEWRMMMINSW